MKNYCTIAKSSPKIAESTKAEEFMQNNSDTPSSTIVDRFRQWIKTLAGNIFAAPYLPVILIAFFIITAATHLAIILMSQPLSYWSDSSNAIGTGMFGEQLTMGSGALIGYSILYVLAAGSLLTFVNYRWSLIGWITAEFLHIYLIQQTLNGCYVSRWLPSISEICKMIEKIGFLMPAIILIGILLVFSFEPAEFSIENKKVGKTVLGFSGILSVTWIIIMVGGVLLSVQKPSFGWVPLEVKNKPDPLQDGEVTYDTKRNKIILFGGALGYLGDNQWDYVNDTWEWDGETWSKMNSDIYPPARLDHAIAYDENRNVVVLFGGLGQNGRLSDTWEWDGDTWVEKKTEIQPMPRSGHEMVYDPIRKKVVIYGGYSDPAFHNDAWEWDGTNWNQIELNMDAPVASVFALSFNTNEDFIFALLSGTPGGTWKWEEDTWTRLYPGSEPSNRSSTSMVYDPIRKVFLTFGGVTGSSLASDTWMFDGINWAEYTNSKVHPSARSDMTMWYDPFRQRVVLFGGRDDSNVYNDMWEFIPEGE